MIARIFLGYFFLWCLERIAFFFFTIFLLSSYPHTSFSFSSVAGPQITHAKKRQPVLVTIFLMGIAFSSSSALMVNSYLETFENECLLPSIDHVYDYLSDLRWERIGLGFAPVDLSSFHQMRENTEATH